MLPNKSLKKIMQHGCIAMLVATTYVYGATTKLSTSVIPVINKMANVNRNAAWGYLIGLYAGIPNAKEVAKKEFEAAKTLHDKLMSQADKAKPAGQVFDEKWSLIAPKPAEASVAPLTDDQIKKLPSEMKAFGERLKTAQDRDAKDASQPPEAQRGLLNDVLTKESGIKSVRNYRPQGRKDDRSLDDLWIQEVGVALDHQFNPKQK